MSEAATNSPRSYLSSLQKPLFLISYAMQCRALYNTLCSDGQCGVVQCILVPMQVSLNSLIGQLAWHSVPLQT